MAVAQLRCSLPPLAGAQYWVYDGEKPVLGPAPLSELGLLGAPVHAALVWGPEKNKIYFFCGGDYWRFHPSTRRVDSPVPRRVTDWRGVPSEIDAAFQDADGVWRVAWLAAVVQQPHLPLVVARHQLLTPGALSSAFPEPRQGSAISPCCR